MSKWEICFDNNDHKNNWFYPQCSLGRPGLRRTVGWCRPDGHFGSLRIRASAGRSHTGALYPHTGPVDSWHAGACRPAGKRRIASGGRRWWWYSACIPNCDDRCGGHDDRAAGSTVVIPAWRAGSWARPGCCRKCGDAGWCHLGAGQDRSAGAPPGWAI